MCPGALGAAEAHLRVYRMAPPVGCHGFGYSGVGTFAVGKWSMPLFRGRPPG